MGQLRIVDLDQRSEAWIAWRLGVLTASRTAAIMGHSEWATPYDVWCEMTGRKQGYQGNKATDRGEEMESPAIAAYEMHHGFIETKPICVLHPTIDYIGASLDAIEMDTLVIGEIKYPSQKSHDKALTGQIPYHYWIQLQHQLMCVPGAPLARYWSHRPDNPAVIEVLPDKAFQAELLEALIAFWDLVRADVPPPLMDRDAKLVDDPLVVALCRKLLKYKEQNDKQAKLMVNALKEKVIEVGGHSRVRCGNVLVTKHSTTGQYRLTVAREA